MEGKRPYIAPEELIYAQPVAINPVGRPIPTIPIKGPVRGTYGPPKPVSLPPGHPGKYGPQYSPHSPPRRGYGPPPKPHYPGLHTKPFLNGPPHFESPGPKPISPSYGHFETDNPYEFEQSSTGIHKDKRVEVVVTGTSPSPGLQEHVHHHYHHNLGETNSKPTVIVNNPVPAAVAAAAESISSGNLHSSQNTLYKPSSGFNPLLNFGSNIKESNGYGSGLTIGGSGFNSGSYGGQTIASYGSSSSGLGSFGGIKPVSESYSPHASYAPNSLGASVGSYGSSDFYKKELNVNGIQSNSILGEQYFGSESARAENYDCVCVPHDQCPSRDIIGRKDDLYLPLDPRNLKSDIEADTEERVITDENGTMTVVILEKNASLNTSQQNQEETHKAKREAPVQNDDSSKIKAEAVSKFQ